MFALTDAEALEHLEFSLLRQHALEFTPDGGPPGTEDEDKTTS